MTALYIPVNWMKGIVPDGSPIPNPAKEPQQDGMLVKSDAVGGTNWSAPSWDPQTGLFYLNAYEGYISWYLSLGPDNLPIDPQALCKSLYSSRLLKEHAARLCLRNKILCLGNLCTGRRFLSNQQPPRDCSDTLLASAQAFQLRNLHHAPFREGMFPNRARHR